MSAFTNDISSLIVARRLMLSAQRTADERAGKKVKPLNAKEAMEEDEVLLSGKTPETEKTGEKHAASEAPTGIDINLSSLSATFRAVQAQPAPSQAAQDIAAQKAALEARYQEEISIKIKYTQLATVDGLVVRSPNLAETDRYAFEFENAYSLKIVDKWSGKYTRIWGDPHVDTSDQDGEYNGEFSDLKGSNLYTTMMLQDRTRITFTALDNGVIEKVDIYKGDQHLSGIGAAAKNFKPETALFASTVGSSSVASSVPMGDTVYAGGDGNDWYDQAGRLIWGQTTSAPVLARPSHILEMSYRRTITQQISAQQIAVKA